MSKRFIYLLQHGDVESCDTIAAFDDLSVALSSIARYAAFFNKMQLEQYYFMLNHWDELEDSVYPGDDEWEDFMHDYEWANKENWRKYYEPHSYNPVTAYYWEHSMGSIHGWLRVTNKEVLDNFDVDEYHKEKVFLY